jgi:cytochrome P450
MMSGPAANLFSDRRQWVDMVQWRQRALAVHAEGPVHRIETEHFEPFWAVIGHGAVTDVMRQHETFHNAPEPVLSSRKAIAARRQTLRTLVHMDAPDHPKYRNLAAAWFRPASMKRLTTRLEELTAKAMARLEAAPGQCDFAVDIALPYPLEAVLEILGMPADDYELILRLTQEMFGQEDPDLRRNSSPEAFAQVVSEIMAYFTKLSTDRRSHPTDDLASAIANGLIDGEPIPDLDALSYYLIIATAGHDTTSYAMAGGMHALVENPEQLVALRSEPALLNNAVEEILRWSSPARHFMRTAQQDTDVAGQLVRKGDRVYLSHAAANLDPTVFTDPLMFDIHRSNADRHVAFGHGVHFCLGAQLARMELRSLFAQLVARIEHIELAGPPAYTQTTAVGGLKRLPIRYTLRHD